MTAFSALAGALRHLLAVLLFFAATAQLANCLFHRLCRSPLRRRIAEDAGFALLFAACVLVTAALDAPGRAAAFPWILPALLTALAAVHAAVGIARTRRSSRRTLSPDSVRQALDNLNSGILFADATGRTVLVNRTMYRLAEALLGSDPQLLDELMAALDAPDPARGVEKRAGEPALYRFPDGRIWRFRSVALDDPALEGFTQTTAQDVTELAEVNAGLERENAALNEANAKMRRMLARIADRIREEESLNLKMRIHNEIGTSLIALSELAADGAQADADRQMETLRSAVRCFSDDRSAMPDAFEDVCRQAEEMKVKLTLDGYLPENETVARLIVAAARECVTNCVRHAQGKHIHVRLTERSKICTAVITNDGAPPDGPVREGGGLSALRRSVERAGGEMHVAHSPRFALILNLPEKETEP